MFGNNIGSIKVNNSKIKINNSIMQIMQTPINALLF